MENSIEKFLPQREFPLFAGSSLTAFGQKKSALPSCSDKNPLSSRVDDLLYLRCSLRPLRGGLQSGMQRTVSEFIKCWINISCTNESRQNPSSGFSITRSP